LTDKKRNTPAEFKRCRHPYANGRIHNGMCEDCVIERGEAANELCDIYERRLAKAEKLAEALKKISSYCGRPLSSLEDTNKLLRDILAVSRESRKDWEATK
jgi:hypothetical protein